MVEGEGFEPSKAEPSDLQSDPFDRSGTPPKRIAIVFHESHKVNTLCILNLNVFLQLQYYLDGAGTRNRTRDLLITSQLLYQLSYASINISYSF